MTKYLKFDLSSKPEFEHLGLNFQAVTDIILGLGCDIVSRELKSGPNWARNFLNREYQAGQLIFQALKDDTFRCPNPQTGDLSDIVTTFVPSYMPGTLAVFALFGKRNDLFVLVFAGVSSRVTQIVIPALDCVVYDFDPGNASFAMDATNEYLKKQLDIIVMTERTLRRRIGLLDLQYNFAHQLMNNLSGLHRLIESNLTDSFDEIWISGAEFFGPTERIFPELTGKLRYKKRSEISAALDADINLVAYKIGSNIFPAELRRRLTAIAVETSNTTYRTTRYPIVVITVRSHGRRCISLGETIGELILRIIRKHPNVGVILDGWVFPEFAIEAKSPLVTALSDKNITTMRQEADLCRSIASNLPDGVLVANLVGASILESIAVLQYSNAYVAHIGTLQHKISWFTKAKGIVHGPRAELSRTETGPYASEIAEAPVMLGKDDIEDIPVETERGQGFYDYRIRGIDNLTSGLEKILSEL